MEHLCWKHKNIPKIKKPRCHDTGSWNPSSCWELTLRCSCIGDAKSQGISTHSTMSNQNNSVPARQGLIFFSTSWNGFRFLPEASFGLRVLSLPLCVCVCQSWVCPRDNSSTIWARITKFQCKGVKDLGQDPYCFVERSTLTFKVKFNIKFKIYPILSLSGL